MVFYSKNPVYSVKSHFDETRVYLDTSLLLGQHSSTVFFLDEIRHRYDVRRSGSPMGCLIPLTVVIVALFLRNVMFDTTLFTTDILLLALLCVGLSVAFRLQMRYEIQTKGRPLVFICSANKREEIETYLDLLIATSKDYTRQKYAVVDPDIPDEVLYSNYLWLLQNHIIDKSTYEALKKQLKTLRSAKKDKPGEEEE